MARAPKLRRSDFQIHASEITRGRPGWADRKTGVSAQILAWILLSLAGPWLWSPAFRPGTTTGGGGGTAHPRLSPRAGLCLHPFTHLSNGCGACYPTDRISWILVPAQAFAIGESMSLYRAGLKLALFLPLGVAMPSFTKDAVRFHRCELRYQPTLTGWCDPRSNPRPQALDTKTYVRSSLIVFSLRATRGAGKTLGQPLSLFAIRPETHRSAIL
jgi:hypothetical protein